MKRIYYAKTKFVDIEQGEQLSVLLNERQAWTYGIHVTDEVSLIYKGKEIVVSVDLSNKFIKPGQIGILKDVREKYGIKQHEIVTISYTKTSLDSVEALKKSLKGGKLNEKEIKSIIDDIASGRFTTILTTYYAASAFLHKPDLKELFWTAKAMANTGETLKFKGIVADKHCIGGVPGNETSMIAVPIIASLGIKIPKSFSKAITSPAATGECVNVLMDISFDTNQIKDLIKKNNCCLIRGGGVNIAPADDKIIQVSYPLSLESTDKAVVSIMAKKYAMGITHCLIDIPLGPTAKVNNIQQAKDLKKKFEYIGKSFGMKMHVEITDAKQPIGAGIGAIMQVREVLRVLQQHTLRPMDLQNKAVFLASKIIELVGMAKGKSAYALAMKQLTSGEAWKKMQKIIILQNGKNPNIKSEELPLAKIQKEIIAEKNGKVKNINMKFLNLAARALGSPLDAQGGLYLNKKLDDVVKKGDVICTLYTNDENKIAVALNIIKEKNVYEIK
ncbi:MAG: thymidine phosphorylase [Candidatus Absconditabacterales bacterium]